MRDDRSSPPTLAATKPRRASKPAGKPTAGLAPALDPLALDAQLCFMLYRSVHAMGRAYKPLLEPLGLTYAQYLVMLVLWQGDGLTVQAIGERLDLDSGTLTPLLRRMQDKGLLCRARDPQDERRVRVSLTAAGRALRQRALAVPASMCEITGLDEQTLQTLRQQLGALVQALNQAEETGTPGSA